MILIFERRKIKIRGHKIKYEDNHRVNNGILEKKCNQHYKWFPEENDWFPCTEEYINIDCIPRLNTYGWEQNQKIAFQECL